MSWTKAKRSVVLADGGVTVGYLECTSTSSVRPHRTGSQLYIFGVGLFAEHFVDSSGAEFAKGDVFDQPFLGPNGSDNYIRYLNPRGAAGAVTIVQHSYADTSVYPLLVTAVLHRRDGSPPVPFLALDNSGTTLTEKEVSIDYRYKDPCVVRLRDGKWLMVLMRARLSDGSGPLGPEACFGDIVGYLADDASFDAGSNVTGPLWIADSLHASPEMSGQRGWLSVPGGCLIDGYVYVYYMVEPEGVLPNPADVDLVELSDLSVAAGTAVSGPRVKRILLADLLGAKLYPESDWEEDAATYADKVVPGTVLGLVRVWLSRPTPLHVTAFETMFPLPERADPDCAWCHGDLSLYFSEISKSADQNPVGRGDGFGVWRGAAIPRGTVLVNDDTGGPLAIEFGQDFLCRTIWTTSWGMSTFAGAPDQISESTDNEHMYIDPDVVKLLDGTQRVYAARYNLTTNHVDEFIMFNGDEDDGCAPWDAAWDPLANSPEPFAAQTAPADQPQLGSVTLAEIEAQLGMSIGDAFGSKRG